jgi:hypothetical protein
MKIHGNDEILKNHYADKTQKNESKQPAEFERILKESVENSTPNPAKTQSTDQMRPVSAVRLNVLSRQDTSGTVKRVDNLLNLLDRYRQQLANPRVYRQQLANPRVTLRTIEPVMNKIAKEKEQLSATLDSLPNADGLKDILNQTLITATLEIIKFNRGDYIPS